MKKNAKEKLKWVSSILTVLAKSLDKPQTFEEFVKTEIGNGSIVSLKKALGVPFLTKKQCRLV